VKRDAPGLGLALGGAAALLIALLFAFRIPPLDRADLAAVDYFAKYRGSPPVSPDVLLILYDDNTVRGLRERPNRLRWAQALRGLHNLGARFVAFDVFFPDEARSQADTELLTRLAAAFGRMEAVYEFEPPFVAPMLKDADRLLAVLKEDVSLDAATAAAKSGIEARHFETDMAELRRYAVWLRVGAITAEEPMLDLGAVTAKLLQEPARLPAIARQIAEAFSSHKSMSLVARRRVPIRVESLPTGLPSAGTVKYVPLQLAAQLLSVGHANTPTRDSDGVLRRAPLLLSTPHGPMTYMGLEAAAQSFQDDAHRAEIVLERSAIRIRQLDRATGAETKVSVLPLAWNGSALTDWAEWPAAQKLTMLKMIEYDLARYQTRVENIATALANAEAPELKRRWADFEERWKSGWTLELDAALDGLETDVVAALRSDADACAAQADEKRKQAAGAPPARRPMFEKEAQRLDGVAVQRRQNVKEITLYRTIEVELKPLVAGKLCIAGAAATSEGDIWSTSRGEIAGVNVHASVANMVLMSRSLRYAPAGLNLVYVALIGVIAAWGVTYLPTLKSAAVSLGLVVIACVVYVQVGAHGSVLLSGAGPLASIAAAFTVSLAWRELVTRRSQRQMRKELERRYSPELVELIVRQPELLQRPRKLTATAFFSDIKGFTTISEGMKPEELISYMNRYHDRMTQLLKSERAFLDKYMGDGIMALFGAPLEYPDHAILGCRAALKNIEATKKLSEEFVKEGLPPISIRIGLNSGEIVAAYVGASDRADYTAIADAVNLAARLEGANKYYATSIMTGEATYLLAREKFFFREIDCIRVVGKKLGVRVYELLGEREGGKTRFDREFLETYDAAMSAFRERNWSVAATLFGKCVELRPEDTPSNIQYGRAQGFVMNPPPAEWNGVFELTAK